MPTTHLALFAPLRLAAPWDPGAPWVQLEKQFAGSDTGPKWAQMDLLKVLVEATYVHCSVFSILWLSVPEPQTELRNMPTKIPAFKSPLAAGTACALPGYRASRVKTSA